MNRKRLFGVILILLGAALILHHLLLYGRPLDVKDVCHHEFFEGVLLASGLTLLLTARSEK